MCRWKPVPTGIRLEVKEEMETCKIAVMQQNRHDCHEKTQFAMRIAYFMTVILIMACLGETKRQHQNGVMGIIQSAQGILDELGDGRHGEFCFGPGK